MYRDVVQWSKIRHRILVKGDSRRQVARETGISTNTIDKMLAHRHPQPYGPRSHRYPRLGPHVASIRRMLQKNAGLPPSARLSVKDIYERVRDEEGFLGGYSTVSDYVRPAASDEDCIWEQPYDLLISLEKKRVLDFLVLLSRADPPVISPARKKQFFHDVGRVIGINPKPNKRAALRSAAFEWMRSVFRKEISDDALRREIGDLPDLNRLLRGLGLFDPISQLGKPPRRPTHCRGSREPSDRDYQAAGRLVRERRRALPLAQFGAEQQGTNAGWRVMGSSHRRSPS